MIEEHLSLMETLSIPPEAADSAEAPLRSVDSARTRCGILRIAVFRERQLGWIVVSDTQSKMTSAHGKIAFVAADLNLFSAANRPPLRIDSQDHGRFSPAMTNRFDFTEYVRPGQKMHTPLKDVTSKVGSQPIGHDRNVQQIGDFGEIPHLRLRQKLCFVDEDTGDRAGFVLVLTQRKQRNAFRERRGGRLQSDPRRYSADRVARVEFRSQP